MSKKLVGFFNDLSGQRIEIRQRDGGGSASVAGPPGKLETPGWNIPDNSDPAKYWDTNRIEVAFPDGSQISFWDDDYDGYKIKYHHGDQPPDGAANVMRGGDEGGDGTEVVIHAAMEPGGRYSLTAVALTQDHNRKQVASHLQTFTSSKGIAPGNRPSNEEVRKYFDQTDPTFMALVGAAEACGFASLGLVWGGGGSFIVGGEVMGGVLTDLKGSVCYAMDSTACTVGAEEGGVAFVGAYLSTEHVEEVGGWEFFWELGLDAGVGVAFRVFTSFSGATGLLVCLTTGEEVEFSVGIGDTSTTAMS